MAHIFLVTNEPEINFCCLNGLNGEEQLGCAKVQADHLGIGHFAGQDVSKSANDLAVCGQTPDTRLPLPK